MNLAYCLSAANQASAMSQIRRKCFLYRLVVQEREYSMHDFSHALRIKLAEFAVYRHSAPDVNRRERRIRHVLFRLSRPWFGVVCWFVRAFWRRQEDLELVGSVIKSQLESVATCFPFPAAESDEACAARELRGVILHDVVCAPPRYKPPDDHFLSRHWTIDAGDFEDVELRSPVTARVSHGVAVRFCDGELERCFDTIVKVFDQSRPGSILVTHREVVEQVFDCDFGGVFLVRLRGERLREFVREDPT